MLRWSHGNQTNATLLEVDPILAQGTAWRPALWQYAPRADRSLSSALCTDLEYLMAASGFSSVGFTASLMREVLCQADPAFLMFPRRPPGSTLCLYGASPATLRHNMAARASAVAA